jgi:hypothetical protein
MSGPTRSLRANARQGAIGPGQTLHCPHYAPAGLSGSRSLPDRHARSNRAERTDTPAADPIRGLDTPGARE